MLLRRAKAMARCSLAGLLAALGPVFGRIASSSPQANTVTFLPASSPAWLLLLLCSCGVVACNVGMWALYISGMDALSSLQATVINSGSNIAWSGILGWLLLGEVVTPRWLAGIGFICLGLAFITAGSQAEQAPERPEDKTKEE